MSDVLPKEQQSAYQRWEMASFGDVRPSAAPPQPPPGPSAESVAELAEQLTRAREEARAQGYAAGLESGYAEGLQQGHLAAQQDLQQIQQIASTFGGEVAHANEVIANDVLDLALDVAKAVLKTALTVRPEIVVPLVGDAIRYLPTLQQPALLFLNPQDALLIKEHMEDELTKAGWRLAEDPLMERGGCRVETASNQIDASMQTRWQRIAAALGKETEWLD